MSEENQRQPLAPEEIHPRSDEEFAGIIKPRNSGQKQSSKCLVYVLTTIVILSAILLIFASIVMRIETPNVELQKVSIQSLNYADNMNRTSPAFNVTLSAVVAVENSNFGGFNYDNATAVFLYDGMRVGEMGLGNGRVKARGTKRMNLTAAVRSEWLPAVKNLSADIDSGMLKFIAYANMSGRVNLLNTFKRRRMIEMNCTINLNLTSGTIHQLLC